MKPRVCSFDFDDCLFSLSDEKVGMLWAAVDILIPNQKIHDLLFEKHREGFVIDIVTARDEWGIEEVRNHVAEYNLPIRDIRWTSGKIPKSKILKEIGSELHVDDLVAVAIDCKMNNIPVLLVDDGRHENNSTADEFDKIFI